MPRSTANGFWDQYSEVPEKGQILRCNSIRDTNTRLHEVYEDRDQHPIPWLHMSYRFRHRGLLMTDYHKVTGIDSTVARNIETPGQKVIYPSFEQIVRSWGEYAHDQNGTVQELLLEGRSRFIDAIVQDKEQLAVYRELRRLMLEDPEGESGFFERSGLTKMEYEHRRNRDRILPFSLLATAIRQYTGTNGETPDAQAWLHEDMQSMSRAYVKDMHLQRKVPMPIASLHTVTEFTGLDFQELPLRELGLSGTTVTAIVSEKRLVETDRIAILTDYIRAKLGVDATDALLKEWSAELRLQVRRKSFDASIRAMMERDNVKPEDILAFCGIDAEPDERSGKVRQALERGPGKTMPPVAMLGALAHTESEYDKEKASILREFGVRWQRSNRRMPEVHAALSYFGVSPEEAFASKEELEQYRRRIYGEQSTMSKRHILERIELIGTDVHLLPALRRAVERMTPHSLADALQALGSRKGGLSAMARAADMHLETLKPLKDGKPVIPKFIFDVFERNGMDLPPRSRMEAQFQYAGRAEAKEFTPLGRALDYIVASRSRSPNHFVNDLQLDLPARPAHLRQLQYADTIEQRHADAIISPNEFSPEAEVFFRKVRSAESMPQALCEWYKDMFEANNIDACNDLYHLVQMAASVSRKEDVQSCSRQELFMRKAALHAWCNGQPYDAVLLFGEGEMCAARLLGQLPGVAREDLLQIAGMMQLELQQKLSAQERLIQELSKPTNLPAGSMEKIALMGLRDKNQVFIHITGDNHTQVISPNLSDFERDILLRTESAVLDAEAEEPDDDWSETSEFDDDDD